MRVLYIFRVLVFAFGLLLLASFADAERLEFDDATGFSEGLCVVMVDDKYGFINKKGQSVINPQFDWAAGFSEGLCGVAVGESGDSFKCGFIDKKGQFVINPQFDGYAFFSEGLCEVTVDGRYGVIDKKGQYVINPQFDDVMSATGSSFFSEGVGGLGAVAVGNRWGVRLGVCSWLFRVYLSNRKTL